MERLFFLRPLSSICSFVFVIEMTVYSVLMNLHGPILYYSFISCCAISSLSLCANYVFISTFFLFFFLSSMIIDFVGPCLSSRIYDFTVLYCSSLGNNDNDVRK